MAEEDIMRKIISDTIDENIKTVEKINSIEQLQMIETTQERMDEILELTKKLDAKVNLESHYDKIRSLLKQSQLMQEQMQKLNKVIPDTMDVTNYTVNLYGEKTCAQSMLPPSNFPPL